MGTLFFLIHTYFIIYIQNDTELSGKLVEYDIISHIGKGKVSVWLVRADLFAGLKVAVFLDERVPQQLSAAQSVRRVLSQD
jgi:hypothetical protein